MSILDDILLLLKSRGIFPLTSLGTKMSSFTSQRERKSKKKKIQKNLFLGETEYFIYQVGMARKKREEEQKRRNICFGVFGIFHRVEFKNFQNLLFLKVFIIIFFSVGIQQICFKNAEIKILKQLALYLLYGIPPSQPIQEIVIISLLFIIFSKV